MDEAAPRDEKVPQSPDYPGGDVADRLWDGISQSDRPDSPRYVVPRRGKVVAGLARFGSTDRYTDSNNEADTEGGRVIPMPKVKVVDKVSDTATDTAADTIANDEDIGIEHLMEADTVNSADSTRASDTADKAADSAKITDTDTPPDTVPPTARNAKQAKTIERQSLPILPICPGLSKTGGTLRLNITTAKDIPRVVDWWKYWHDMATAHPNRILAYVYRIFPHTVTRERNDPNASDKVYEFPLEQFEPTLTNLQHWVLSTYGSGNYYIILYDTGLQLRLCTLYLNGIWDWDFPPLSRLGEIDPKHPNNSTVVQEMERRYGRSGMSNSAFGLPEGNNRGNDMSDASVLTPMVNTIKELAANSQRSQVDPNVVAEGVSKTWANTTTTMMEMLRETNRAQAAASDPMALVGKIVDVAKAMVPPPQPPTQQADVAGIISAMTAAQNAANAKSDELLKTMLLMEQKRADRLEEELRESRRREEARLQAQQQVQTNASTGSDLLGVLDKVIGLRDKLTELGGDGEGGGSVADPKRPWYADVLLALAPALAPALQQAMAQSAPAAQPFVPATTAIQANPTNGAPQPPTIPQPAQPGDTHGGNQPMNQEAILLRMIGGPMLNHLNSPGLDGVDFAIWFIGGYGRNVYSQIAAAGKDLLLNSIRTNAPELWAQVSGPDRDRPGITSPTPAFVQFLGEFLDTAEVERAMAGGGQDGEESAPVEVITPTTPAAPKPQRKGAPGDVM